MFMGERKFMIRVSNFPFRGGNSDIRFFLSIINLYRKKSNTPKCFNCRCNLCLEEKIQIMIYPDPEKLLNQ